MKSIVFILLAFATMCSVLIAALPVNPNVALARDKSPEHLEANLRCLRVRANGEKWDVCIYNPLALKEDSMYRPFFKHTGFASEFDAEIDRTNLAADFTVEGN